MTKPNVLLSFLGSGDRFISGIKVRLSPLLVYSPFQLESMIPSAVLLPLTAGMRMVSVQSTMFLLLLLKTIPSYSAPTMECPSSSCEIQDFVFSIVTNSVFSGLLTPAPSSARSSSVISAENSCVLSILHLITVNTSKISNTPNITEKIASAFFSELSSFNLCTSVL